SASHRTARGASIEVCEGTDGHHFGLPRGGHLPWRRGGLRHYAQDGEAGGPPARGGGGPGGGRCARPELWEGRRAGRGAGGGGAGDLGEAAFAGGGGGGVCGVGPELPAAGGCGQAGVAGRASPWPPPGGVVAG